MAGWCDVAQTQSGETGTCKTLLHEECTEMFRWRYRKFIYTFWPSRFSDVLTKQASFCHHHKRFQKQRRLKHESQTWWQRSCHTNASSRPTRFVFFVLILWSGACARHCSHSKFLGKRRLHYRNATHPDNLVVSLTFSTRRVRAAQSVGADEAPGAVAWLGSHVSVRMRMIWARPAQIPHCDLVHPLASRTWQGGVQRFGCRTKQEYGEIIIAE